MDTYETSVIYEVRELMSQDGYLEDEEKVDEVLNLIRKILNSKIYFESIKNDFDKILEDKKIDSNDISKMIIVMLKLNNILPKILDLKKKVSTITKDKMKYIFYATLYLYIRKYQPDFFDRINVCEFGLLYTNLWSLVEINPETINITKKKVGGFLCCGNIEEREEKSEEIKKIVNTNEKQVKFNILPNNTPK